MTRRYVSIVTGSARGIGRSIMAPLPPIRNTASISSSHAVAPVLSTPSSQMPIAIAGN